MTTVFAGDTPDFLFTIKDADGNQIDASDDTKVNNVVIVAYSRFDPKKILCKCAIDDTGEYDGYDPLQTANGAVKLILPAEGTKDCVNDEVIAQITTILNTDGFDPPGQVITGADTICKIVPRVG